MQARAARPEAVLTAKGTSGSGGYPTDNDVAERVSVTIAESRRGRWSRFRKFSVGVHESRRHDQLNRSAIGACITATDRALGGDAAEGVVLRLPRRFPRAPGPRHPRPGCLEYLGGKVPFGFVKSADGRSLIEDPVQQAAIRRIRELRSAGLSSQRISAELKADGVPLSQVPVLKVTARAA